MNRTISQLNRAGALCAAALALGVGACGHSSLRSARPPIVSGPSGLAPSQIPIRAGRGPRYRLPALSALVARRAPIAGLRCARRHPHLYGIHLELFAHRLVLPVSSGIGVAPPVRRQGVYVLGGACSYPLRTLEPTGVVRVDRMAGRVPVLGTLFAIWGQPLSSRRLADFSGPVLAFVDGHRWRGASGAIPLHRHAQIVLEVDGFLPPHPRYEFPPGL
jgi:hypothetical protein